MAHDVTGCLVVSHGGKDWPMRLTMRGIATLQAEFGTTLGGLLDGSAGGMPDFAIGLRMIEVAILRENPGTPPEVLRDLADDLLTADRELMGRLLVASFPNAATGDAGNGERPQAAA